MMAKFPALLALLLLLGIAQPALAWGAATHRLIAQIALANMAPATRTRAQKILSKGDLLQTPGCPIDSLETASVWPDCVRASGDRFAFASKWHYQNFALCQPFGFKGTCPGGNCLTIAIKRQLAVLGSNSATDRDRVQALAFVVHFVGDLHQPLHVSDNDDRGGNEVKLVYRGDASDKMSLHRLWDRELPERALALSPAITAQSVTIADRARWSQGEIADWAQESWEISHTQVYSKLPGLADSCTAPPAGQTSVPDAYIKAMTPVVRTQIERAGVRLALLLDRTLR